jgi:DNA-binding IclR family transcriptional regulator
MLTDHGWLVRDPQSRRYLPGRALIEVAHAAGVAERLPPDVDNLLRELRDRSGETVALHQLVGRLRLCIAGIESEEEVRSVLQAGETRPLDRGASSRVILAFCPGWLQRQILDDQSDDVARATLIEQLAFVAEHGFLSIESNQPGGSAAVAVPLFTHDGVYGAIAIAGPASRFVGPLRDTYVPDLFRVARQASRYLGGPADRFERWGSTG